MSWYQPLDQRILEWRRWRINLPADTEPCLNEIQQWWQSSPWRKNTKLTDDINHWPTPWTIFDNLSYCDGLRALGMFYTVCLIPRLRALNPEIWIMYSPQGERMVITVLDNGRHILNLSPGVACDCQTIKAEFPQIIKYCPQDFKTLE